MEYEGEWNWVIKGKKAKSCFAFKVWVSSIGVELWVIGTTPPSIYVSLSRVGGIFILGS